MTDVADFLMVNYYPKYKGNRADVVPTIDVLMRGLSNHHDKIVIVRDESIKGVAIFVTLTDEFYGFLKDLDITRYDILANMLKQHGPNVHFVLLCADGYNTIMTGVREVIHSRKPKTVSWWNPDLTKLHHYQIGE